MKKKQQVRRNRKFSLKDRFRYWFDNRMAKGSFGLIRVLIIQSIILALIMAGIIILFGFNEEGEFASVFWNSVATVFNRWVPNFHEGSLGYIILMTITAGAGILFNTVLIGAVTNGIDENIDNLKRGNSPVLEKDHIIVLGFCPGEYMLFRQLILAASGKPACVVVAENMDKTEMEQKLLENLDVPYNFRIVCRTVDITNPASLEKCSFETCRTVIINPMNDIKTIKAVLAVSALFEEKEITDTRINAIISKNDYRFSVSLAEAHNVTTLQTNRILAKMIAHSCTQTGLAETFREILNFEGSEFYLIDMPEIGGMLFEELTIRMENAVPIGVIRNGKTNLNPGPSFELREDDRILVFSEELNSARLGPANDEWKQETGTVPAADTKTMANVLIIGFNETLPLILRELPENVTPVYLEGGRISEKDREKLDRIAALRGITLKYYEEDPRSEDNLAVLAKLADHIVIMNEHDKDHEEADMDAIALLVNLRYIRSVTGAKFNITVEMQMERNQKLVNRGEHTDFIVASSMSSLILVQLAENPEFMEAFQELLSIEGNEMYLKNAGRMQLTGTFSVRELRRIMMDRGYVLLGHLDPEKVSRFDIPLDEKLTLTENDSLIVIGEN